MNTKIVTSKATFPIVAVFAILLWTAGLNGGSVSDSLPSWFSFATPLPVWALETANFLLCCATIYLLIELNNTFSIIGSRSVLHSWLFLLTWVASPFISHNLVSNVMLTGFVISIYHLFKSYQRTDSTYECFYTFACLGGISLFAPQVVYFFPFYWFALYQIQALSLRNFLAGILGILFSYWWFFTITFVCTGSLTLFIEPFRTLVFGEYARLSDLSVYEWVMFAFLVVTTTVSGAYSIINSHRSKLRVRSFHHFLINLSLYNIFIFLLCPESGSKVFVVMQIVYCLLSGRLFSQINNRLGYIFFIASIVILVTLSLTQAWMSSSLIF